MNAERSAIPGTAARMRATQPRGSPAPLRSRRMARSMRSEMCWSGMSRYLQTAGSVATTSRSSSVTDDGYA